jgi:hypothetical protein
MRVNAVASREAKEEGLAKVHSPTLTQRLATIVRWRKDLVEFTGEDLRIILNDESYHPNAWGAAINALIRKGLIVKTGEYRQMKVVSSHARTTPVYRKV